MSSTAFPTLWGLSEVSKSYSTPPSENWDLTKLNFMFQRLGMTLDPEHHIVVRAFNLRDQKAIEALEIRSGCPNETFTIVKHAQCYVNRSVQDYFVLQSPGSVFSSERLKLLREGIDQRFFLPAAVKDGELCFFAPDMIHVKFAFGKKESDIEHWASELGLVYHPHNLFLNRDYDSAVVHLNKEQNIVSAFEQIIVHHDIDSVKLHELPDPEYD